MNDVTSIDKLRSDNFVTLEITEQQHDCYRLFLHKAANIRPNDLVKMLVSLFSLHQLQLVPDVQIETMPNELAIHNQPKKVHRFIIAEKCFFANADRKFYGADDFVDALKKLSLESQG